MKIDWEQVGFAAAVGAFVVFAFGVALAIAISGVAAAMSYANCEFNPTSERCKLVSEMDRVRTCKHLDAEFCK